MNFEPEDFVKNVVEDPAQHRGAIFLQGYLGDSDKEDHVRLYFDPGLNNYADIKKEDVLHLQKIAKTKNPLGGVLLWVKNIADYGSHTCNCGGECKKDHQNNQANQSVGQQYFQGNIYNRYMGQPQAAAGTWPTTPWLCLNTQQCR